MPACTLLNDEVWVTGGYDDGAMEEVDIFNLSSRTWRTADSMKKARSDHTAATVNGTVSAV